MKLFKVFKTIIDIFNPKIVDTSRDWVNKNPSLTRRMTMWIDIITNHNEWTCKKCGGYAPYYTEKQGKKIIRDCKECIKYHAYVYKAAPNRLDAKVYLTNLWNFHINKNNKENDGLFTEEDYDK